MSDQKLIELVKAHLAAFCSADWSRHQADYLSDAVYIEKSTGRSVQGAEKITAAVKAWVDAFPDMTVRFNTVLASGNKVAAEVTWAGTQTGPLTGPTGLIPATFRRGTLDAVVVVTFEGDKIKEYHHYFDLMSLLRAIGAMPAAATAVAG